jgi:hypothetical protein
LTLNIGRFSSAFQVRTEGCPRRHLLEQLQVRDLQQHPEPVPAMLAERDGVPLRDRTIALSRRSE